MSVFKLPELAEFIAEYLTPYTIVQCMCVNKQLHHLFTPLLFRRVSFHAPLRNAHKTIVIWQKARFSKEGSHFFEALKRHLHDVRVLNVSLFAPGILKAFHSRKTEAEDTVSKANVKATTIATSTATSSCTGLRQLKIVTYGGDTAEWHKKNTDLFSATDALLTLLDINLNLTELYLTSSIFLQSSGTVTDRFLTLLTSEGKLPVLRKLSIVNTARAESIPTERAVRLIHAPLVHGSLQELVYKFGTEWNNNDDNESLIVAEQTTLALMEQLSMANTPLTSTLKALTLPSHLPGKVMVYILLNWVHNLSSIDVPFVVDESATDFVKALRTFHPKLRRIIASNVFMAGEHGYALMTSILQAYRPEILVATVKDQELQAVIKEAHDGIRSFQAQCIEDQQPFMEALLEHYNTLEEVDLRNTIFFASQSIQQILSSCKSLTRFSMSTTTSGENVLSHSDMIMTPWVCAKLRVLDLRLSCLVSYSGSQMNPDQEALFKDECTASIFTRIGSLTELEELGLDLDPEDYAEDTVSDQEQPQRLTLPTGLTVDSALRHMKGMKKLRVLRLSPNAFMQMDQAECGFMAREWPLLNEIEFNCCTAQDYWTTCEKEHWKWFKGERPGMRLWSRGVQSVN
ncbi:hypothetical protein EDD21DRAFT_62850 [Dissophora ornata]|nr:hypothetical protein EDD21DRAFT_62850 [Dissophora ornata]